MDVNTPKVTLREYLADKTGPLAVRLRYTTKIAVPKDLKEQFPNGIRKRSEINAAIGTDYQSAVNVGRLKSGDNPTFGAAPLYRTERLEFKEAWQWAQEELAAKYPDITDKEIASSKRQFQLEFEKGGKKPWRAGGWSDPSMGGYLAYATKDYHQVLKALPVQEDGEVLRDSDSEYYDPTTGENYTGEQLEAIKGFRKKEGKNYRQGAEFKDGIIQNYKELNDPQLFRGLGVENIEAIGPIDPNKSLTPLNTENQYHAPWSAGMYRGKDNMRVLELNDNDVGGQDLPEVDIIPRDPPPPTAPPTTPPAPPPNPPGSPPTPVAPPTAPPDPLQPGQGPATQPTPGQSPADPGTAQPGQAGQPGQPAADPAAPNNNGATGQPGTDPNWYKKIPIDNLRPPQPEAPQPTAPSPGLDDDTRKSASFYHGMGGLSSAFLSFVGSEAAQMIDPSLGPIGAMLGGYAGGSKSGSDVLGAVGGAAGEALLGTPGRAIGSALGSALGGGSGNASKGSGGGGSGGSGGNGEVLRQLKLIEGWLRMLVGHGGSGGAGRM